MSAVTSEGQEQLLRRLQYVADDRRLLKVAQNAFRKSARLMRREIVKRARKRGILRRLYGRRVAGLNRMIKLGRVRKLAGGNFQVRLGAGGLMAIQERGGTFRPHIIVPSRARRLAFVVAGRLVVTSRVRHPGATHPKMPAFWPGVEASGPHFRRDVAEAIRDHLEAAARIP